MALHTSLVFSMGKYHCHFYKGTNKIVFINLKRRDCFKLSKVSNFKTFNPLVSLYLEGNVCRALVVRAPDEVSIKWCIVPCFTPLFSISGHAWPPALLHTTATGLESIQSSAIRCEKCSSKPTTVNYKCDCCVKCC